MFLSDTKITIALGIVALALVSSFVIFYHETPEECFVREMKEWSEAKGLSDKVVGLTQKDEKMSVSKAKTIAKEFDYKNLKEGESRDIFLQVGVLFEYCSIE